MSFDCGQAIEVQDLWGTIVARFVAQCSGRWLIIRHDARPGNGLTLQDWRGVLRELVALTVPAKLTDKQMTARSMGGGKFTQIPLTYPLPMVALADLIAEDFGDVRAVLDELAVQVER